ncbi:AKT-interacting protein [Galendromus occidentalis]|uniref:AKT-interacting protein n=1 Tax=Galendromus occidentalis TaxID=34638 RepID=A0AAJ7WIZ8_9ACAR|nr:AKT-interacting protein [Galendromus occidentalis]
MGPTTQNAKNNGEASGSAAGGSLPRAAVKKPTKEAVSSHPTCQANAPRVEVLRTYGNVFLEYTLMNEYAIFRKKFLPGVYIMPSFDSALKWFCVIFIRTGIYEGGAFRLLLEMSPLYPEGGVPRVIFDPPVFHPLIHAITGEMDVSCKIAKWRREENHIYQVVEAVKSLFEKIPEDSKAANREASKLHKNNPEEFKRVVEECIAQCMDHLQRESPAGDPNNFDFVAHDAHDLSLSFDESSLFSLRMDSSECSTEATKSPQRLQGLSWMRDGKPWAKEGS